MTGYEAMLQANTAQQALTLKQRRKNGMARKHRAREANTGRTAIHARAMVTEESIAAAS